MAFIRVRSFCPMLLATLAPVDFPDPSNQSEVPEGGREGAVQLLCLNPPPISQGQRQAHRQHKQAGGALYKR